MKTASYFTFNGPGSIGISIGKPRGMTVVATEVKSLASQTAKATEEISAQIASIQQESMNSVEAIESIRDVISQMSEIATAIASAVEDQSAATRNCPSSAIPCRAK